MKRTYDELTFYREPSLSMSWGLPEAGSVGRKFHEPIVMVPGNAKARRRWWRRDLPNTQRAQMRQGSSPYRPPTSVVDMTVWAAGIWAASFAAAQAMEGP